MDNQDNSISKFFDEWYSDDSQKILSILKLSLTKEILSSISKKYLPKKKHSFHLGYRNSGRVYWTIKKTFWFFLWSGKWIMFFDTHKNKKVLLAAIGSNLNNIDVYLDELSFVAKKNNCVIVLLNLIESYKHLSNHQLYYFPRFFYFKNHSVRTAKVENYKSQIIDSIKILSAKNNLQFSLESKQLVNQIKSLLRDYSGFSYLVNRLISPKRIVGLMQDYDYTYNKYIYYKIATRNGIKTYTIDTSLQFYQHLYKKTFSDYHLVWGEFKKNFILSNNSIDPLKILITGKPSILEKYSEQFSNKCKLWIYIAQSYSEPSMFITGRDYTGFEKNVRLLSDFQKKNYPNAHFIIKIHPADRSIHHKCGNFKLSTVPIFDLIKNASIIFVEDTTLAVELFANNFPIVYVLDKFNNDNIGLVNSGLVPGIDLNGAFDRTIKRTLEERTMNKSKERENIVKYYLGNFDENNFKKVVTEILFYNKDNLSENC